MGLESIDLTKARHRLITLPAMWLCVIFVAGWTGKVWIANAVGLSTREEHAKDIEMLVNEGIERDEAIKTIGDNVNDLALEIRVNWAYQMLNTAESNLSTHISEKDHSATWEHDRQALERKVRLANEYKTCIVNGSPNCSMIQRQILQ